MEKGLFERTGKDLKYWINIVKAAGLEKHAEMIQFLKSEHGFTHGYANFVALKARNSDAASHDPTELIKNQYAKGKEGLKSIYEAIVATVKKFGSDVTVTPKKNSVSLIRKKQFALIKPATKTRIDLGLKLKGKPITERLETSGPFGTMCTHRVRIIKIEEVDEELIAWLKEAYQAAG